MISRNPLCSTAGIRAAAAILAIYMAGLGAGAQALSVLPVNIFLQPGQKATTLTVTNQGTSSTAIQVRGFVWSQKSGEDELTASDDIVVSPPIATIPAGATQVVRLILRQSPVGQEGTYRILVDQIPPPAEPGVVHIVLRLSIPVFAQPETRAVSHVLFHIEHKDGKLFLVGVNDGTSHDVIRDIALTTSDGKKLNQEKDSSPYILAGTTRSWPIAVDASQPLPTDDSFQLTAHSLGGAIAQQVSVIERP
jgi:fimbrial chaperone protein